VCFTMGFGLGLATAPSTVAAQSSVPWNERGVVTGAAMFARSVGSALGVAAFGAVANHVFSTAHADVETPSVVVDAAGAVFLAVLIAAVFALASGLAMPHGAPVRELAGEDDPTPAPEGDGAG